VVGANVSPGARGDRVVGAAVATGPSVGKRPPSRLPGVGAGVAGVGLIAERACASEPEADNRPNRGRIKKRQFFIIREGTYLICHKSMYESNLSATKTSA